MRAAFSALPASRRERGAIDARVAQHDVVVLLGEPQRFGEREGEDAAVTRKFQRGIQHLAHPDRLRCDADRHATRAHDEVERIVAERVDVDRGDRTREARDGRGARTPVRLGTRPGLGRRHRRRGEQIEAHGWLLRTGGTSLERDRVSPVRGRGVMIPPGAIHPEAPRHPDGAAGCARCRVPADPSRDCAARSTARAASP